jgi:glutathione S-transferase
MLVVVHSIFNSRSQRILWLCEHLKLDYTLKYYQRNLTTGAGPPELYQTHPLGKSPMITIENVAETGAILEYLINTYGSQLKPSTEHNSLQ